MGIRFKKIPQERSWLKKNNVMPLCDFYLNICRFLISFYIALQDIRYLSIPRWACLIWMILFLPVSIASYFGTLLVLMAAVILKRYTKLFDIWMFISLAIRLDIEKLPLFFIMAGTLTHISALLFAHKRTLHSFEKVPFCPSLLGGYLLSK